VTSSGGPWKTSHEAGTADGGGPKAQQALAAAALQQLREHTGGLDAIVREEIRSTLIEELTALARQPPRRADAARAEPRGEPQGRGMERWGHGAVRGDPLRRRLVDACPRAPRSRVLRTARDELTTNIARLTQQGGQLSCDTASGSTAVRASRPRRADVR